MLWVVSLRCFGYLGTVLSTPTPCIVHHHNLHFRIAYSTTHHCISTISLSFRNHHRFPLPPFWHLTFEILSSRFFRFLRCFGYLGMRLHHLGFYIKNTTTHHRRTVTFISSWYRGIPPLYIPLAIALLTPSPFCVTCLSRLAIWVLPATLLVHNSGLHLPLHTYHTISYWYHIIPCVTRLFPHIHNCYLGLCISQSGHTKKEE